MMDEIFDRTYQSGRSELHDGVDRGVSRLVAGIGTTFRAIEAINFASPWAKAGRKRHRNVGCA